MAKIHLTQPNFSVLWTFRVPVKKITLYYVLELFNQNYSDLWILFVLSLNLHFLYILLWKHIFLNHLTVKVSQNISPSHCKTNINQNILSHCIVEPILAHRLGDRKSSILTVFLCTCVVCSMEWWYFTKSQSSHQALI